MMYKRLHNKGRPSAYACCDTNNHCPPQIGSVDSGWLRKDGAYPFGLDYAPNEQGDTGCWGNNGFDREEVTAGKIRH